MAVTDETDCTSELPARFAYRPELRRAATPQDLRKVPRHRWLFFPHSFSHQLVLKILEHWELQQNATLADNFVGSGTTLVVAREQGFRAMGYDLSPLAVMATNAKVAAYKPSQLKSTLNKLLKAQHFEPNIVNIPQRLTRAFTKNELREIHQIIKGVRLLPGTQQHFFLTALLSTARQFSRAIPDGGWFRWKDWPDQSTDIQSTFQSRTLGMIEDVLATNVEASHKYQKARLADARKLPLNRHSIDGLITSPPYANRHDYSRVFHIELLLLGSTETEITAFRHSSLRSHVEAKRQECYAARLHRYSKPQILENSLASLPNDGDKRIRPMLEGYFEDIFLSLQEVYRVLRVGGRAAYIVGNVRHLGIMVPVDDIIGQIAVQVGLVLESAWVMRLRGNSAQQMKQFGREPSRESVLLLSKGSDA